jgi:hypothetical protein
LEIACREFANLATPESFAEIYLNVSVIKMGIVKSSFDQNNFLNTRERGVCVALVLQWLNADGRKFAHMARSMRQARAVTNSTVTNQTIVDYGLEIVKAETFQSTTFGGIDSISKALAAWKVKKFLIGFSSPGDWQPGHAIGLIKFSDGDSKGFDPNNGYYDITSDSLNSWIVKKLIGANFKRDHTQISIWGCN